MTDWLKVFSAAVEIELAEARAQWLYHNLKFHLMARERLAEIQRKTFPVKP